jgi:N-acetylglucosamine-6-phosphate deacetylase
MQFRARRVDTGQTVVVTVGGHQITGLASIPPAGDEPWVSPGFVDLQINGYGGREFNDVQLTTEQIESICRSCAAMGVTRFCPTVTTHTFSVMADALQAIAKACHESPVVASRVAGIHLEGPYISREDGPRGAHPVGYCRPPDWNEFRQLQDAAEGRIRLITLSPEYPGSGSFVEHAVSSGLVVAIGHTNATSAQIHEAVEAGASLSTHLGNGAHAIIRRHPNYIWDQLAEDRLAATLIADGHHLPAAVVKSFLRAKGPERCILVSDIVGFAGMSPGIYSSRKAGMIEVLDDGRIVVAGQRQYLFGAGRAITYGIANVMRFAELDLATAVEMACGRPATALGLSGFRLEVGAPADLVLFDLPATEEDPLRIRATLQAGELAYGSLPAAPASRPS